MPRALSVSPLARPILAKLERARASLVSIKVLTQWGAGLSKRVRTASAQHLAQALAWLRLRLDQHVAIAAQGLVAVTQLKKTVAAFQAGHNM